MASADAPAPPTCSPPPASRGSVLVGFAVDDTCSAILRTRTSLDQAYNADGDRAAAPGSPNSPLLTSPTGQKDPGSSSAGTPSPRSTVHASPTSTAPVHRVPHRHPRRPTPRPRVSHRTHARVETASVPAKTPACATCPSTPTNQVGSNCPHRRRPTHLQALCLTPSPPTPTSYRLTHPLPPSLNSQLLHPLTPPPSPPSTPPP